MKTINYSELSSNLKGHLDNVEEKNETLIIRKGVGEGIVMISRNEYNSLIETLHLLSSKANADWLYESIQQMKEGKTMEKNLIED